MSKKSVSGDKVYLLVLKQLLNIPFRVRAVNHSKGKDIIRSR